MASGRLSVAERGGTVAGAPRDGWRSVRASIGSATQASAAELAEGLRRSAESCGNPSSCAAEARREAWRAELEELEVRELCSWRRRASVGPRCAPRRWPTRTRRRCRCCWASAARSRGQGGAGPTSAALGRDGAQRRDDRDEFVPRISARMQQCVGCQRRVPGVSGLIWSTVFFPRRQPGWENTAGATARGCGSARRPR